MVPTVLGSGATRSLEMSTGWIGIRACDATGATGAGVTTGAGATSGVGSTATRHCGTTSIIAGRAMTQSSVTAMTM